MFVATLGLAILAYIQVRGARDAVVATREAARAQLQPIVYAHAIVAQRIEGPCPELGLAEGDVGFAYYLSNEGTGIALNVRHGVCVAGEDHEFHAELRALRPGEEYRGHDPVTGKRTEGHKGLVVRVPKLGLAADVDSVPDTYWVRFESVFGDLFETRNPPDPEKSATFTGPF